MALASIVDRITVRNYRCFRAKQTARLAPLTLLVGENSTGKTSFLALIRALWDIAVRETVPDFKEYPYDLGSFREISHDRGAKSTAAHSFEAGFSYRPGIILHPLAVSNNTLSFDVTLTERGGAPFPEDRRIGHGDAWVRLLKEAGQPPVATFGTSHESWALPDHVVYLDTGEELESIKSLYRHVKRMCSAPDDGGAQTSVDNWREIDRVLAYLSNIRSQRPFASAPVRSRPRRTYDPARPARDPEGEYTPTYLNRVSRGHEERWQRLQRRLETFGRESGLFDEIVMRSLGKDDGSPFQVQIRKYGQGKTVKGPGRNLVDVGYGVSQTLPILTELLREDSPDICLLQQPEVHLHPSAQAALGSLFCSIAASSMQLIVETHSDHLLDRVRMDVRDEKTKLKAEDVSILFFEPGELDVTIHSLRLDKNGNVLDAPPIYRQFFMNRDAKVSWALMCAIVDNDVRSEVFGQEQSDRGALLFDWLTRGAGRLVVGGLLRHELTEYGRFRTWLGEAIQAGRARIIPDSSVDLETESIRSGGVCESNDHHVIALARVSGARLLFTNDGSLENDFKNAALVAGPRGKIYKSPGHRHLLNRRDLCPSA